MFTKWWLEKRGNKSRKMGQQMRDQIGVQTSTIYNKDNNDNI